MINMRGCDLCRAALADQVTRLEFVRGAVTFLPRDRWSVEPSAAGIRVRMICLDCDEFLREAVRHLTTLVNQTTTPSTAAGKQPGHRAVA